MIARLVLYVFQMSTIILADRLSKLWALRWCQNEYEMTPWLSCQITFNRGVSWSLFDFEDQYLFGIVSSVVVLVTLVLSWYTYHQYKNGSPIYAELTVIAGSVSNIIDRFWYDGVIDLIKINCTALPPFPVFNIADVAIVIGVIGMLWEYYKNHDMV